MRAHVVESDQMPEPEVPLTDPLTDPLTEVPLTRRERRAAARGAGAQNGRIPVKAGAKLPAPPVRHRDYATRKRG